MSPSWIIHYRFLTVSPYSIRLSWFDSWTPKTLLVVQSRDVIATTSGRYFRSKCARPHISVDKHRRFEAKVMFSFWFFKHFWTEVGITDPLERFDFPAACTSRWWTPYDHPFRSVPDTKSRWMCQIQCHCWCYMHCIVIRKVATLACVKIPWGALQIVIAEAVSELVFLANRLSKRESLRSLEYMRLWTDMRRLGPYDPSACYPKRWTRCDYPFRS